MSISTYFSHSYRLDDQPLNKTFWHLFSEAGFTFSVDPPSDTTIHTHLERMMGRCSAFVAVINRRRDVAPFFCSRFVLYEYGLAIQARRPRLLLIDGRVSQEPFKALDGDEKHFFSVDQPLKERDELARKIERLRRIAENYPNRGDRRGASIALLMPPKKTPCSYRDPEVLSRMKQAALKQGFQIKICEIPYEHNAFFALDLDTHEAVILDVRGSDLPPWVFAYLYGRLIPTIKLAQVLKNETPDKVPLPPLVMGLRMDEREPGVESVTYWRDAEDLFWQLSRAFHKLDEEQTVFKSGIRGELYFGSIGRLPARVFISNAGRANAFATRLSEELRIRSIEQFHYKEVGAIPPNAKWERKIREEVQSCDVFLALVGPGYPDSKWCRMEMKIAASRLQKLVLLPYRVEPNQQIDLNFMEGRQAAVLPGTPDKDLEYIVAEIEKHLKPGDRGRNRGRRQTTLLGASRESVVDAIRHVSQSGWKMLGKQLLDLKVAAETPKFVKGAILPRGIAENLLTAVAHADAESTEEAGVFRPFVKTLAKLSPGRESTLLKIAKRGVSAEAGEN